MGGIILWENPNPTVAFNAQTVTLSSSDYDYYEIYWATAANNSFVCVNRSIKGYVTTLVIANADGTAARRQINYISDTRLNITTGNGIPIKIIGYKS